MKTAKQINVPQKLDDSNVPESPPDPHLDVLLKILDRLVAIELEIKTVTGGDHVRIVDKLR